MALPAIINPSQQTLTLVESPVVIEDYVFGTPFTLPQGHWMLTTEKGEAWIFTDKRNFTLKANETMMIDPSDGDVHIKRLYVKSVVKFQAEKLA